MDTYNMGIIYNMLQAFYVNNSRHKSFHYLFGNESKDNPGLIQVNLQQLWLFSFILKF